MYNFLFFFYVGFDYLFLNKVSFFVLNLCTEDSVQCNLATIVNFLSGKSLVIKLQFYYIFRYAFNALG